MSALEIEDLNKILNYFITNFIWWGLLEKSVLQQCKQYYTAQGGQEKQKAIQQSDEKNKKTPTVSPMPLQVQPPAAIHKRYKNDKELLTYQISSGRKWLPIFWSRPYLQKWLPGVNQKGNRLQRTVESQPTLMHSCSSSIVSCRVHIAMELNLEEVKGELSGTRRREGE
jgi:hypothetical protein